MDAWPANAAACRAGKGNLGVIMAFHKNIGSFIEFSKLNYNEILEFLTRWTCGLLTLLSAGL